MSMAVHCRGNARIVHGPLMNSNTDTPFGLSKSLHKPITKHGNDDKSPDAKDAQSDQRLSDTDVNQELEDSSVLENTVDQECLGTENNDGEEEEDGDSSEDDDDDEKFVWKFDHDTLGTEFQVDLRDQGTADNWVRRNPQLVRLTGRHPFNCEPPLARLMEHGFITPVSLHYVRNHGHVPHISSWNDWTVEICGLVKKPMKFTMPELVKGLRSRDLPVTLVCAGNRRKEQNAVKQTIGFNWGPGAISTNVWRGIRLWDVLDRCGIMPKKKGALFVCFEGAEKLHGEGSESVYGTSIAVDIAMDPARDVLLAYMQNGELLHPDHGFPVRMIIPGFIGGRMVKWVKRIEVASRESGSYYHYYDNRVCPSHVDAAEKANAEGWWFRPDYIINELNINSVITTPSHGEVLPINPLTLQRPYCIKGYAYSGHRGGGRKVIRVELTFDGGETWNGCKLNHPEKPTKYGKYWCWCFWEFEVEMMQLLGAKELSVRAWDASMNTQPKDLTWNLLGMMNNSWFRIKISACKPKEGGIGLIFEHPTVPGNQSGGWMASQQISQQNKKPILLKSSSTPVMNTATRQITISEVKSHNSPESPWIIINHHVYDCTHFLKDHPGGPDSILINAGTDCTEEFDAIHSSKAKAMLEDYRIGELIMHGSTGSSSSDDITPDNSFHGATKALTALPHMTLPPIEESSTAVPSRQIALNPKQKLPCKLLDKKTITHDVRLFRFGLPSQEHILGLPVGKHIFLSATVNGKLCIRAYTPVTSDDEIGYFDLLIKIYHRGVHPNFPEGGLMSQYLDGLSLGDIIDIKGPIGHIHYQGRGNLLVSGKHKSARKIAMLAGGTGITPMYQLINAIINDPGDHTEIYLVYANRSEDDILLRTELDERAKKHSNFKVWYVISTSVREGWTYSLGFIREEILREHIPEGSSETIALMCGPPAMIQFACLGNLEKMKYDSKNSCFQF
eukprot:Gb_01163 [translate_table: standard]